MTDPKRQIVQWCRDGDQQVFRHFYREQAPKLWKFLVARGCDRDTAYDILAEAFLRFTQTVCRDPRAPVALLYRIALNLRIDAHRRGQSSPVQTAESLPDSPGFTEPEEYADVRALVFGLPDSEQNMLLMRYWIGLSHKEVAAVFEIPEGTVRRQCAEVLDKLHKRLDEQ